MNGHESLTSKGPLETQSMDLILQLVQLNAQMFADLISYKQFANRFNHYLQFAIRDPFTSIQTLIDEFGRMLSDSESKLFNVDQSMELIIGLYNPHSCQHIVLITLFIWIFYFVRFYL